MYLRGDRLQARTEYTAEHLTTVATGIEVMTLHGMALNPCINAVIYAVSSAR